MSLQRFVEAQDAHGTYDRALEELRRGHKASHWMWFVLPQLAGLGRSATAQHYAVASLDETREYLAHPLLGPRLRQCATVLLDLPEAVTAEQVFGPVDAMKLRSSATLFAQVEPGSVFDAVLERFFPGPDAATLDLLGLT